jgi:hypothetical protein
MSLTHTNEGVTAARRGPPFLIPAIFDVFLAYCVINFVLVVCVLRV